MMAAMPDQVAIMRMIGSTLALSALPTPRRSWPTEAAANCASPGRAWRRADGRGAGDSARSPADRRRSSITYAAKIEASTRASNRPASSSEVRRIDQGVPLRRLVRDRVAGERRAGRALPRVPCRRRCRAPLLDDQFAVACARRFGIDGGSDAPGDEPMTLTTSCAARISAPRNPRLERQPFVIAGGFSDPMIVSTLSVRLRLSEYRTRRHGRFQVEMEVYRFRARCPAKSSPSMTTHSRAWQAQENSPRCRGSSRKTIKYLLPARHPCRGAAERQCQRGRLGQVAISTWWS